MPLPSSPGALGASNRRSRRTPSADSNVPAAASPAAEPALVACTSIVPGVPSGNRTIRHGTPPTLRRPSTANRSPHNGCARRGDRHLPRQRRAQLTQSVLLVVPGRKTDVKDAQWLCQLLEAGLLRASFVPPKPIRTLRNLTRYRKAQIHERSREAAPAAQDRSRTPGSSSTASRPTSSASPAGRCSTRSSPAPPTPTVLADLAKGRLRAKIPALREALEGRFDDARTR